MSDRELGMFERAGTHIQHKTKGTKGYIKFAGLGGYYIHCITYNVDKFIPYSEVGEYVVIE